MDIRRATAGDAGRLLPLIADHAVFEGGIADVTEKDLVGALASDRLIGWVAEDAETLFAYATATLDFSTWRCRPFLHLDCLFVSQAGRNGGIGRRLLETIAAYADHSGIGEMQWQTPDWNEAAARFYVRSGATCAPKLRFALKTSHAVDRAARLG